MKDILPDSEGYHRSTESIELSEKIKSRLYSFLNESAGSNHSCATPNTPQPATSHDEVRAFKNKQLQKLGLGYIIPYLHQEVQ